jgi:hypothetical protein
LRGVFKPCVVQESVECLECALVGLERRRLVTPDDIFFIKDLNARQVGKLLKRNTEGLSRHIKDGSRAELLGDGILGERCGGSEAETKTAHEQKAEELASWPFSSCTRAMHCLPPEVVDILLCTASDRGFLYGM